jgi:hypothetical protein
MSPWVKSVIFIQLLAVAGIYLFVTAPAPLAEAQTSRPLSTRVAFEILNQENARVRGLYTEEIVAQGMKQGLKFSEGWRTAGDGSGPLPALFLRTTAETLAQRKARVRLFLVSEHPINRANAVNGEQARLYQTMYRSRAPVYAEDTELGVFTAMFPDLAVTEACVQCHNKHEDSAKKDWSLGQVMGAVTWTYPEETMSPEELASLVDSLRSAIGASYDQYLRNAAAAPQPPVIGERWPRAGYYLPTREVFMSEMNARTSSVTLSRFLSVLLEAR